MKLKTSEAKQFFMQHKGKRAKGRILSGIICGYGIDRKCLILLAENHKGFIEPYLNLYIDLKYINHNNGYYIVDLINIKLL